MEDQTFGRCPATLEGVRWFAGSYFAILYQERSEHLDSVRLLMENLLEWKRSKTSSMDHFGK